MKDRDGIKISPEAREHLTDNEYKYLILLEFHEKFQERVKEIRKKPKIKQDLPDSKELHEQTLLLVSDLDIPITLIPAIENLIQYGEVKITTHSIQIINVKHQLNRKQFYSAGLRPPPPRVYPKDRRPFEKAMRKGWHRHARRITSQESIAPALPLIQINKVLKKADLHKAIDKHWKEIEEAMESFKNTVPYPIQIEKIRKRDLEINLFICRSRKNNRSHKDIYEELKSTYGVTYKEEDAEVKKKYYYMRKLLKNLGFIKN